MSKDRRRPPRVWPPLLLAAVLFSLWAASAQFPFTIRPNPRVYVTLQRGCAGVWVWAPAERPTLGISDNLNFTAQRSEGLVHTPFLWCDRWGFGVGGPVWLAAAVATVVAIRRYTVTSVREAPPAVRWSRRKAVAWTGAWCVATLGLAVTAGHRDETILRYAGVCLSAENGALVLGKPEDPVVPAAFSPFSAARVPQPATTASGPPSRQGSMPIDLLPDYFSDASGWRAAIPLWPLLILAGWLAWRALAAASRGAVGACAACGYSLEGLAAGTPCPECGTVPRQSC